MRGINYQTWVVYYCYTHSDETRFSGEEGAPYCVPRGTDGHSVGLWDPPESRLQVGLPRGD